MKSAIPNFGAMVGNGMVERILPVQGKSSVVAVLQKSQSVSYAGNACESISLLIANEEIVSFLSCDSGKVYICPGGNCSGAISETKQLSANKFQAKSTVSKNRYQVEFLADRFIYRIQERNCLIKYPHGCLIYGFGWHEEYAYGFSKL